MRRHPNDDRNRVRRGARQERDGSSDQYDRGEDVGHPVTDYASHGEWDQRGMAGYGGGGSFGGMGYPMSVGGHGTYVAGHRPYGSSQPEQSFRGRGPRGYRRSDDRIREDVCDRLTEDHDLDASDIGVVVEAGEVTLEGTVEARRNKWLAEEIAARCSGVLDVHNHLRVKRPQRQDTREEVPQDAEAPRNGNGGRTGQQTQTAQTGLGAQNRTDR